MKTYKYLPLAAICSMVLLTGCDENAWNDHLDGFDDAFNPTQVETIEYTLTDADYAAIASNKTNKALAEKNDVSQALSAISGTKAFSEKISAADYVPAFLESTAFPYYTLTDGSILKLTYNVASGLPEQVTEAPGATLLTVPGDFYSSQVWESDDNYIDAFAPSKPASKFLTKYLNSAVENPEEGQYAIVSYNEADQNPVFGNVGGDEPASFEMSSTVGDLAPDDGADIYGVVGGVCNCGFVITDLSGSIFVYMGSGYDPATYPVGTQLHLEGTATSYKNNIQIAAGAEITKVGTQEYVFPPVKVYTGALLDEALTRPANVCAEYIQVNGKVSVNVSSSGNTNYNIIIDGAEKAQGSVYYPSAAQAAALVDGASIELKGWFISISGSRYCNIIIDQMTVGAAGAPRKVINRAPAAEVPSQVKNAVYKYDGSKWSVPEGFIVLNPADYAAMGLTSSGISEPAKYLPIFLKQTLPYAQADESKFVLYLKNGSYTCDNYIYNGSEWVYNNGKHTETSQFVLADGKWMFDPNVIITLPVGKGQAESAKFYQACVDWVYENKCVPLGDTSIKSGKFWVTSYGNNDYYCGASAYQNNVDLRAASARNQYPAGWEGYTDEQIRETMEKRFTDEVVPAVLAEFYPDANVIPGIQVIYTLNFYAYEGTHGNKSFPCKAVYEVTGKAEFKCISSEWLIGMD